jgi:hypothetical protein
MIEDFDGGRYADYAPDCFKNNGGHVEVVGEGYNKKEGADEVHGLVENANVKDVEAGKEVGDDGDGGADCADYVEGVHIF